MPTRLHRLRFQGLPFSSPTPGSSSTRSTPRTRETSGEGKEGAETVAPTHGKVLLNFIFQEFIEVLVEFLLGRGVCSPHSCLASEVWSQLWPPVHPGESEGSQGPRPHTLTDPTLRTTLSRGQGPNSPPSLLGLPPSGGKKTLFKTPPPSLTFTLNPEPQLLLISAQSPQ